MELQIRQLILYNNQIIPYRGYEYLKDIKPLKIEDVFIDNEGRLFLLKDK